jgi:hypothetical protein
MSRRRPKETHSNASDSRFTKSPLCVAQHKAHNSYQACRDDLHQSNWQWFRRSWPLVAPPPTGLSIFSGVLDVVIFDLHDAAAAVVAADNCRPFDAIMSVGRLQLPSSATILPLIFEAGLEFADGGAPAACG